MGYLVLLRTRFSEPLYFFSHEVDINKLDLNLHTKYYYTIGRDSLCIYESDICSIFLSIFFLFNTHQYK